MSKHCVKLMILPPTIFPFNLTKVKWQEVIPHGLVVQ